MDSRPAPCPTCDDVTDFVQPPCVDGHIDDAGECPEWVCTSCGSAFVIGDVAPVADVVRARIAA